MIQKTNIDTLHKEGKSQRVITEMCGCLQSAVSKHIKCKVDWKEEIWVGKGAQATGMTASLRIQSSKADSNTWESFTRSGLKLESVHQESPRSDVFRKRATKPLLNQRQRQKHLTWEEKKNWTVAQWSKVLFSDESKFCISFGNQGPRVWRKSGEAQNPCCLKSSVKFPQSVMIWAAMSSAGVGPLCFLKFSQRSHLPGNFRALHASFCWQALWRCWFHFPAGLGTCPHCQRYQKLVQWPWCYCAWLASKLAWPEPHRESMGYCQEEDERHQTQQCRWPEGHCQRNLGFHTTSAVPQTDHLHATPNWGSN